MGPYGESPSALRGAATYGRDMPAPSKSMPSLHDLVTGVDVLAKQAFETFNTLQTVHIRLYGHDIPHEPGALADSDLSGLPLFAHKLNSLDEMLRAVQTYAGRIQTAVG